ncbi:LysR family transcriptional regulator [Nitrospirillum viridazoti]|uniref:LysR family transcriptional regulator n=1 Tax=Nitrospirillum viridazoti CBAmc TaxID=1441467 RepID=A0A248JLP6_9PROT|nr:LysR family transcriptional regulator [Nitrospirillum amazonense]ASG19461.1 LysR family transcriptional regulator [Nitrospirillum amazonense CBAmc]TWB42028.1 DNA-binding transcriptional LysR family regulator [Nitrospirillum amazonense]
MDRLRAFEVFATVVARGGFAKAADALNTSPANVTRYVNELETYLGSRLLNRTSRRLSLTEAGEALYERAQTILEEVAEAEALASATTLKPRGRLRVNAPLSFGIRHLAPLWPRFMAQYPDVLLDIALTDRVVDMVEEGFDLGIRISRGGSPTYAARKLATSRNVLCAAPDYLARQGVPRTPDCLANHVRVAYSYTGVPEDWVLLDPEGKPVTVRVPIRLVTNNGDTARAAALAGQGIIWQPTFLIGDDLRAGRLVPVLPDHRIPDIDILAVYPSRRHVSAKVRALIDFLADAFHGTPAWECRA